MDAKELESIKDKLVKGIQESFEEHLKETGQVDKINSEFGAGVSFGMGIATGTLFKVFKELEASIPEKEYEIWAEIEMPGGKAHLMGHAMGTTFKEACDNHAKTLNVFRDHYDPETLTFHGKKLFDNEADARKSFE